MFGELKVKLQQALKWADDNSQPEAVGRLRSREVAQVLAAEVRRLQELGREAASELNDAAEMIKASHTVSGEWGTYRCDQEARRHYDYLTELARKLVTPNA